MNKRTRNLLCLIAMTIFADRQILSEEIHAFVRAIGFLQSKGVLTDDLSEQDIIRWYEANKTSLSARVSSRDFKNWFYAILSELDAIPDKSPILLAMTDIAKSDDEFHVSEVALVRLASMYWGQRLAV